MTRLHLYPQLIQRVHLDLPYELDLWRVEPWQFLGLVDLVWFDLTNIFDFCHRRGDNSCLIVFGVCSLLRWSMHIFYLRWEGSITVLDVEWCTLAKHQAIRNRGNLDLFWMLLNFCKPSIPYPRVLITTSLHAYTERLLYFLSDWRYCDMISKLVFTWFGWSIRLIQPQMLCNISNRPSKFHLVLILCFTLRQFEEQRS